ncbi:hypothetical protein BD311DRAFT_806688 [Dichomitus squalens]|uniref:Uncharacterized protein n=1 Tax=Dichomitus squalens TaxID=114155 RepID=A0A4V2K0G8_9APHY|nr:hypothetical protein BD311DRAFT_806688 [Dichomitus squalens]
MAPKPTRSSTSKATHKDSGEASQVPDAPKIVPEDIVKSNVRDQDTSGTEVTSQLVSSERGRVYATLTSSRLASTGSKKFHHKLEKMNVTQWCLDYIMLFEPMNQEWITHYYGDQMARIFEVLKRDYLPPSVSKMLDSFASPDRGTEAKYIQPASPQNLSEMFQRAHDSLGITTMLSTVQSVTGRVHDMKGWPTPPTEDDWKSVWNSIFITCYRGMTEHMKEVSFKHSMRGELFINYPRLDLRDISENDPDHAVHHTLLANVYEKYREAQNKFRKDTKLKTDQKMHMEAAYGWTERVVTTINLRAGYAANEGIETSHQRLRDRLSQYPPHGRFDAALLMNDTSLYTELVQRLREAGHGEPETMAEERLTSFECCVTREHRFPSDKKMSVAPGATDDNGRKGDGPQGGSSTTAAESRVVGLPKEKYPPQVLRRPKRGGAPGGASKSSPTTGVGRGGAKQREFFIPLLLVEYKRKDVNESSRPLEYQGDNQRRMYTTSAARFLSAMGMADYPVFGMTAAGTRCYLSISWYSTKFDLGVPTPHVIESKHESLFFDLEKPVDILQFIIFLFRLGEYAQQVWKKYQECREMLLSSLAGTKEPKSWTLFAQRKELGTETREKIDKGLEEVIKEDDISLTE